MDDLLTIRDLEVEFGGRAGTNRAVDGVSLRVQAGKTVALVGESGSGKSTIAQAVMGLLPNTGAVTGGSILFRDPQLVEPASESSEIGPESKKAKGKQKGKETDKVIDLARLAPKGRAFRNLRGDRISMIFQDPMTSLSPLHPVGEQVAEGLKIHNPALSKAEREERVMAMFAKVGFPDPKRALSLYPFELSGGLRQRAMIAMALICGPALLIADEPTTALDVTVQAQILKLMRDLQAEFNMAILLITHDLGVVANMADEVAVVYHGRLMESGPADALFQNPKHPYLQALFGALPTLDDDPERRLTPVREIPLIDTPLLNKADGSAGGAPAACEGPLLSVKALEKSFTTRKGGGLFRKAKHSHPAVIDVSFDVMQGDSLGLVGESGSGKTTVSRLISRLLMPDRGQILFAQPGGGPAADLASLSQTEVRPFRRRIQYVFQDPTSALDPRMTVFGLLSEPMEIQEVGDRAYRAETAKELMRLVGLDQRWLGRYANSFSGGQRQRIGIARALALRPELLLLDEPVSALDVSVQAQILNLLKDLRGALGLTYLFVSHNLAVVRYLCDTIAVMCAGRIVEYGPTDALFADARHPYTQALLTAVPHIRLDHPLDFEAVARGRASVPAEWPAPFGFPQGSVAPGIRVDCGNGHWVLQGPESAEVGTTTEPGEAA